MARFDSLDIMWCGQDGDATDASSWTCTSGEVCEITYDLQAVESLDQVRIGENIPHLSKRRAK